LFAPASLMARAQEDRSAGKQVVRVPLLRELRQGPIQERPEELRFDPARLR
jgi:hypothetical protein